MSSTDPPKSPEQLPMFDYDDRGLPKPRRDIILTPFAPTPSTPTGPDFDGMSYDPLLDYHRLSTQLRDVWDRLTADPERWWTLSELCAVIEQTTGNHHTEAAVSARLRDLRKPKFGRYTVQRKPAGGGLFYYRLDPIHYRARLGSRRGGL